METLRELPQSVESEQALIGAVLQNPAAFDEAAEIVSPADFFKAMHRAAWEAIQRLLSCGGAVDAITVATELAQAGDDMQLGYLAEMQGNILVGPGRIKHYAMVVRNKSRERELLKITMDIGTAVFESDLSTAEKIDMAQARMMELTRLSSSGPKPLNQILKNVIDEVDARFNNQGELNGLSTGLIDLDKRFNGLRKSDFIVLAGRPSMGKTTLAMNIAGHNAIRSNKAVLVFSLEMSSEQLSERMLSAIGGVKFDRIRKGALAEEDWPRLSAAIQAMKDRPLIIDDRGGMTLNQIRSTARHMARQHNIELIVIDYLQLITHKAESRERAVAEISKSLKDLAKELSVPVLAVSQLSRSVESRTDKRPIMSDLRDSGSIEQDADIVAFVYRDEVYNPEGDFIGSAEVITRKFRNGEIGTDWLRSQLDMCRFVNGMRPAQSEQRRVAGYDDF